MPTQIFLTIDTTEAATASAHAPAARRIAAEVVAAAPAA